MAKGRMIYVPKIMLNEIDDLKTEHKIKENKLAITKIVEYTRVGRQLERMMTLNFKYKPTTNNRRIKL